MNFLLIFQVCIHILAGLGFPAVECCQGRQSLAGCCMCLLSVLPQIISAEMGSLQTLMLSVISDVATDTIYHGLWLKDDKFLPRTNPSLCSSPMPVLEFWGIDMYRQFLWGWMRSWRFLPDAVVFPHFKSMLGDAVSSFIAELYPVVVSRRWQIESKLQCCSVLKWVL